MCLPRGEGLEQSLWVCEPGEGELNIFSEKALLRILSRKWAQQITLADFWRVIQI